ncbi:hypothetical protein B0H11DRAFT_2215289 [Mycena galericulata]|nr:hypothetical protein B0H11DRAFT_2215289 [Mycena galericulata]
MATFRTTSIIAEKPSSESNYLSRALSIASFTSLSSCTSRSDALGPIIVSTTVSTSSRTYPATVPPPFATSLGSDEILPRPRRGAPPVAPAGVPTPQSFVRRLRSAVGFRRARVHPALCEGW